MFEGFEVHTNRGMDEKPESLYAREITGYYHSVHPVVAVVRLSAKDKCKIWDYSILQYFRILNIPESKKTA